MSNLPEYRTVGVPNSYFLRAARTDYVSYRSALARELVQNSDDAHATLIEFTLDKDKRTLLVSDNGVGMSQDTLVNKFLTLGASQKDAGSVGGFGKAKELIAFSWESYQIATLDNLVCGSGAEYTIGKTNNYVHGTQIFIKFPEDEDLSLMEVHLLDQLSKNQPRAEVKFNGDIVSPLTIPSRSVRTVYQEGNPIAKIYTIKNSASYYALVRLRGIYMFSQYIGNSDKTVVVEMLGDSVGLLTSNRDGLMGPARNAISQVINEIIINPISSLKEKAPKREYYMGENGPAHAVKRVKPSLVSEVSRVKDLISSAWDLKEIMTALESSVLTVNLTEGRSLGDPEESFYSFKDHIVKALDTLTYRSDFVLQYSGRVPKRLHPHTMSRKNLKLATLWEIVLREVLLAANLETKFSIGWTLNDPDILAEVYYDPEHALHCYLLNPNSKYLQVKGEVLQEMVDLAVHEVAHTVCGSSYHDENFTRNELDIRRKTRKVDFKSLAKRGTQFLLGDTKGGDDLPLEGKGDLCSQL